MMRDYDSGTPACEIKLPCPKCGMDGVRRRDTVSRTISNWYRCGSHEFVTTARPHWDKDAPAFKQSEACAELVKRTVEPARIVERILAARQVMAPDVSTTDLDHVRWWEDGVRTMAHAAAEAVTSDTHPRITLKQQAILDEEFEDTGRVTLRRRR